MFSHLLIRNPSTVYSVTRIAWLVLLLLLVSALASRATTAQTNPPVIQRVRNVEPDEGALTQPIGLAFSPLADAFYLVENGATEGESVTTTIRTLTSYGEGLGSITLDIPRSQPLNMTYDSRWNRLLLWDAQNQELLSVAEQAGGILDPATLTRHPAAHWGVQQATGMTFDGTHGHLYLLDGAGPRLLRVEPAADGNLDSATVTPLELAAPLTQSRGLAYEAAS